MGLQYAILTMLMRQPFSGYDLVTQFRGAVGFLWNATHQQIYRELERMRRAKLVSCKVVVQHGRPNKKIYSITDDGRDALLRWVAEPGVLQTTQRAPMLLRAYSYGRIPPDVALARLEEYRALHLERLTRLRGFFDEAAKAPDEVARLGSLLALKAGILHQEAYVGWCDWAADLMRRTKRKPKRTRK